MKVITSWNFLSGKSNRKFQFQRWLIVVACFCLTLTLGETFWTFGVFFNPLQIEFGWNRASVSSIFTAFLLGYAFSVITSGRLVDRYNPKPVLIVSALIVFLGLYLCSVGTTISQFRFFLFLVGLGSGATWAVPTATVQRWFYGKKDAGLALGIVTSGVGVGALIFAPLINFLIQSYGWRNAFMILGILFGTVVGGATLILKPIPSDHSHLNKEQEINRHYDTYQSAVRNQWYASWTFAAIIFVVVIGVSTSQIISTHIVVHATDIGISHSTASAALGIMGGFTIPGRILSGFFSAWMKWYRLLSLAYFGMFASMVCLWFLKDTLMLYLFAISYGMFHGVRSSAQVGVLPEIFGIRSLGELIGISTAAGQLVGAIAPYAVGALFDATHSYSESFLAMVFFLAVAGVVAGQLARIAARKAQRVNL